MTLPILGIPVRFESDAREVLEAVEESFGAWRAAAVSEEWIGRPPVRVRIRLAPSGEVSGPPGAMEMHRREPRFLALRGEGVRAYADTGRRAAAGRVSRAMLERPALLRGGVIEALTLWLLTALDRQPLHAAGVVRGDTALLLAGPSGVGKSTTAYAAMRAGLGVLAEDCVYLQERPVPRVWGLPGFVNLLAETARWFPELASVAPTLRASGDVKLAMPTVSARMGVARAGICLLARGDVAGVERVGAREVERALLEKLEPGFDRFAATIGGPVRRLAERGGWRLTLPPSPPDAVPLLHRVLDE
ncbi:MAG TPA: hypothetical protein VNP72_00900, partial [Longimicrobium sp.]|nr:hypothetical protein [Longimicrobium sp.]